MEAIYVNIKLFNNEGFQENITNMKGGSNVFQPGAHLDSGGFFMKTGTKWTALPIIMLTLLLLLCVHAAADTTPDGYTYTVGAGGVTITDYSGTDVNLVVPGTIGGQNVISIGTSAFSDKSTLKSILLPDSVTSVGNYAFYSCFALESLSLGSGLQTVGSYAFSKCYALTSLNVPDGVTAIGANAFDNDIALTSVELPDNLRAVNSKLFLNCGELTGVTIPAGVTTIYSSAFSGCDKLTSVAIPNGVTAIWDNAFNGCTKLSSAPLPASLRSIGSYAFKNCSSLTGVSVPTGVTAIQYSTYEGCSSLLSVSLPDSVQSIGSYAFKGCANLTTINLPEGLTLIDYSAFQNCEKLANISLPSSLTTIGVGAFRGCKKLTSINIPLGVTSLGNSAFSGCSALTSVSLPWAGLTTIGEGVFSDCSNLASIDLPNSLTSIGDNWFSGCANLASINLPNGLASIGDRAFEDCASLSSIDLPDDLVSIGDGAFSGCGNLRSVDLPSGVTLGIYAFSDCGFTSLVIPEGMTTIVTGAFSNCSSLKDIYIPRGVTTIGSYAFTFCTSLEEIVLPDTVTSLGACAFYDCEDVESIVLPRSITSIGSECFAFTPMSFYVYNGSYAQQHCAAQYPSRTHTMGITMDPASYTLGMGDACQILYEAISPYKVEWTSSDPLVASVDQHGTFPLVTPIVVVTAVSPGIATITAVVNGDASLTASCQVEVKRYASGVTLDQQQMTLYAGTSSTLTPIITPNDATDKTVTWSSSNESVATVADGVVTALKAGTATITSTAADGSGKSATCQITVKQYATGVALDKSSATLYAGETLTLNATVSPGDASDKGVNWESKDTTVATISSSGVVTGVKAGTATITATAADSSGMSASCEITVWTPADGVTVGPVSEALLKPDDELTLTADVQPADAHDRSVAWTSSKPAVARVQDGAVTAVGRGVTTITATTHNGKTATCIVTVEDRLVDLTLSVPDDTPVKGGVYIVPVNGTLQIGTSVKPEGIGYRPTFKSSYDKVASVGKTSGLIKGIKNGQVTITVTSKDLRGLASKSKTLKVSVFTPVGSVSLPGEAQILPGAKKKLTATIAPSSASDKTLTWDSDDETVAKVAADGTVTALKTGTANITATATNGQAASCLVRVTDRATDVQITTETGKAYMDYKSYMQLTATVDPGTAYERVTWKSTNTAYVTVDANGRVYGKKVGKPVTIYATAADGTGVRGSIAIQVITPVTGVFLPETDKIFIDRKKKLTATFSPSSPTFKTLTWESSDDAVATVDADGTVMAKALGTAVITATAYNGKSDSCTVSVAQPVTEITLTPPEYGTVVYKGETTEPLEVVINPGNASDQGVTWKSFNEKYAKVNSQGQVIGRNPGKVKITATAKDGSGVAGSINLTVAIPATSIKLNKPSAVLYHNGETDALKTVRLTAAASPKGSVYRSLTWSVESGADAVRVDESTGLVTAVKDGPAVIRAETDYGPAATCTVTVRTLPATFSLNTTEKTLAFKKSFNLGAEAVFDEVCTEKALTWSVKQKKKVVSVSSTGLVKASKDTTGTAIITAKTKNGKTATCKVTVVKSLPPKGAPAKAVAPLCVTLRLSGGSYVSCDDRVADVNGNGEVTLKRDGEATLEVDGKQISVKVEDGNLAELKLDEGTQLLVTADEQVRWTVKDGEVATVDGDGRLTALKKGTTTLTCQAENGGEWTVRIVVTQPDGVEPQPEPEPSDELEAFLPEPTHSTEPTIVPEPEPTVEPTSTQQPTPSAEPEPSIEPEPTAKPEPEKTPEAEKAPDPQPSPASADADAQPAG